MAGSGLFGPNGSATARPTMKRPTRRRLLAGGGALGLTAIAGCTNGGPGDPADEEQEEEPPEEEDADEAQPEGADDEDGEADEDDEDADAVEDIDHEDPDGEVEFVQPEDGDEVTSPVEIEAEVEEFDLEAVEEDDVEEGVGHLHVIVDEDCVDPGYVIPHEEGYHHLEDGETETELDLEPGEYDLCLQMGDGNHDAYDLTDEITIEVVEDEANGDEDDDENGDGDDENNNQ